MAQELPYARRMAPPAPLSSTTVSKAVVAVGVARLDNPESSVSTASDAPSAVPPANVAASSSSKPSSSLSDRGGWSGWSEGGGWSAGGGWSKVWGSSPSGSQVTGWVWVEEGSAQNSSNSVSGPGVNSQGQGSSSSTAWKRSKTLLHCSEHGGDMHPGSHVKVPKLHRTAVQKYVCRSDKPCSACPASDICVKDAIVDDFAEFVKNVFVTSTTGKLTGASYTAMYQSLRDKKPFEGINYSGRRPPPRRFEENSMQPLLMWPTSDSIAESFWPQNGRVMTAKFHGCFQDYFGCIWHNIWVYDVS